jgi:transposase
VEEAKQSQALSPTPAPGPQQLQLLAAAVEGVEPTNNAAERAVRPAALWHKRSFGCHSGDGCRFAACQLTVVQTLRMQKRRVLDYVQEAVAAHRAGLTMPQLLNGA